MQTAAHPPHLCSEARAKFCVKKKKRKKINRWERKSQRQTDKTNSRVQSIDIHFLFAAFIFIVNYLQLYWLVIVKYKKVLTFPFNILDFHSPYILVMFTRRSCAIIRGRITDIFSSSIQAVTSPVSTLVYGDIVLSISCTRRASSPSTV